MSREKESVWKTKTKKKKTGRRSQSQWRNVCAEYIKPHTFYFYLLALFFFLFPATLFAITLKWCGIFTWPWLLFIALEKKTHTHSRFIFFSVHFRVGKLIFNEQNRHINFTICIFIKPIDFHSLFSVMNFKWTVSFSFVFVRHLWNWI